MDCLNVIFTDVIACNMQQFSTETYQLCEISENLFYKKVNYLLKFQDKDFLCSLFTTPGNITMGSLVT